MATDNGKTAATVAWQGKWIGRPDACHSNWQAKVLPAPFFRKEFNYDGKTAATIHVCGLGYHELYVNGRKVGDGVLDPVVTQYDQRVRYLSHDVTSYLRPGKNAIGVVLGNGWYNCHTSEVWHFDKVSWRDYPKLLLQLELGGKPALCSDSTWKVSSGPIVFDGLRNGETYDARLELGAWAEPGFNDADWKNAGEVNPPGGLLDLQTMPSCKVTRTLPAVKQWTLPGGELMFDFGQNLTGWARMAVKGDAGAELELRFAERLTDEGDLHADNISSFIKSGDCQTDRYILKGQGVETWEPRFAYHGFQYAKVKVTGDAKLEKIEARLVHTSFDQVGGFSCSDATLNKLQECTVWSYLGNFTGIPTDCPHREKNGWTGDAQLASETGLFNFASGGSYDQWMDSFADVQRPDGQLPGIVPSGGWGFNWGSGPAWDSAAILIPRDVHLLTGDLGIVERHYETMRKYVDYCTSRATGHIVSFGLGDWCPVEWSRAVEFALTSTGFYYVDALVLSQFAALTGRKADHERYAALAADIKQAFNQRFYRGDGVYAKGEQTAMGCAVYQGLVEDSERAKTVAALVKAIEANGNKLDFGILGAKYVPRALADNGHAALAYHLITQPEFPGWVHWLKQGATTLWESWKGGDSRNHIMFGDISAWMFRYLGGIAPDPANPGFKHVLVKPCPVPGMTWAKAEHRSPLGKVATSWKAEAGRFELELELPQGATATVTLPDGAVKQAGPGHSKFQAKLS